MKSFRICNTLVLWVDVVELVLVIVRGADDELGVKAAYVATIVVGCVEVQLIMLGEFEVYSGDWTSLSCECVVNRVVGIAGSLLVLVIEGWCTPYTW